jgi:hypothetical protein
MLGQRGGRGRSEATPPMLLVTSLRGTRGRARNTEAERLACEIRLRSERKAGELLAADEKNSGGVPSEPPRAAQGVPPKKLADLGISKSQSSRWQQPAAVPEAQFEAVLAAPVKPTTSGIIAQAAAKPGVEPMDEQALWLWGRRQAGFHTDSVRRRDRCRDDS